MVDSTKPKPPMTLSFGAVDTRRLVRKRQFTGIFTALGEAGEDASGAAKGADGAATAGSKGDGIAEDATTATAKGGKGEAAEQDPAKVAELAKLSPADRAAKAKDKIKQLRDDPMYMNCLGLIAGNVADAELHIGGIPDGGWKPMDKLLTVVLDSNVDAAPSDENVQVVWTSHNDAFYHNNRMEEFECKNAGPDEGKVSAYNVTGGCCQFYKDNQCKQPLFSASNREDMDLPKNGPDNDIINSVACTYDGECKGLPGQPGGADPNEYATGACGVHVVQYQRPTAKDSIKFSVTIFDANGVQIGQVLHEPAFNDLSVPSRLAAPGFSLTVNGDNDVDFHMNGLSWNSDKAPTDCKFGAYDGRKVSRTNLKALEC